MSKTTMNPTNQKKKRIPQSDIPRLSLDAALRIPKAIVDNYASEPSSPLKIASAVNMQPTSGPFRMLCGAAAAYGLTKGSYNSIQISLEPLGKRIIKPTKEGDDLIAMREAILRPRILGEFIQRYSNSPLPPSNIAVNVLEDMGVPSQKSNEVFNLIIDGAESVGFITDIKGKKYIDLSNFPEGLAESQEQPEYDEDDEENENGSSPPEETLTTPPNQILESSLVTAQRRVYITHGKNKDFIEPIKKLLGFGELTPVISTEKQSVSKPVPEKVMDDMRSCGAAIIHVEAEQVITDKDGSKHQIINQNVLIEIGAAMALYGRRYILLVREGVKLPSNLQGLYEVRYEGDSLDGDATIRLLEAINDIKTHPLPNRYKSNDDENLK